MILAVVLVCIIVVFLTCLMSHLLNLIDESVAGRRI